MDATVRDLGAAVCPLVFLPLHKGADGWMSEADYRRFYWPTLKAVLMGLVDQGAVPVLFAEGSYNRRLSVIVDEDLPAGSLVWWFDQVDMAKAKQALRQYACIAGNVPSDVLTLGEAHETALTHPATSGRGGPRWRLHPRKRCDPQRGQARQSEGDD